jgi:hypothetical protein
MWFCFGKVENVETDKRREKNTMTRIMGVDSLMRPQQHCLQSDSSPENHPGCLRRAREGCADCCYAMNILPGRSALAQYEDHEANRAPEETGSDSPTTH